MTTLLDGIVDAVRTVRPRLHACWYRLPDRAQVVVRLTPCASLRESAALRGLCADVLLDDHLLALGPVSEQRNTVMQVVGRHAAKLEKQIDRELQRDREVEVLGSGYVYKADRVLGKLQEAMRDAVEATGSPPVVFYVSSNQYGEILNMLMRARERAVISAETPLRVMGVPVVVRDREGPGVVALWARPPAIRRDLFSKPSMAEQARGALDRFQDFVASTGPSFLTAPEPEPPVETTEVVTWEAPEKEMVTWTTS